MNTRFRPARGFTLVEVLVAMSIMATVAIMSWRGVDGIMRTRTASQEKLDQLLRINAVLAQWEQDLNSLQPTAALKQNPTFDGARLTLTRRSPNGVQLVVWSLKNNVWLRWAGTPVTTTRALEDQWLSSKQFIGNEPGQLRALTGVSQWQVYYNRDKSWTNAQSTGDAPETSDTPQGVRLLLSFSGEQGTSGNLTRDISLKK